jgi:ATP-binding cassette subfamily B protein
MGELKALLPYFRPYRAAMLVGVVCVVFANAFQIAIPYLTGLAIDELADPTVTARRVAGFAGLIVVAAALGGAFRFGMRQLLNGVSRRIEADLRNDFFQHLLRLDATFYGSTRTGDLMSRATNDTLAVRMAAGPAIMYTINTVASFVFALALMLIVSPRLTAYVMLPMIALPPVVLRFGRIIHARFETIQERFSDLSTFVQENLTGVRIVRAYTQELEQGRQFDAYNEEYRAQNMRLALTAGAFHPLLELIAAVGMAAVTGLGAVEVIAGRITIGEFVAFGLYVGLLIWPMIALGWVVSLYQRGAASMGRLNKILQAEPVVAAPLRPVSLANARGRVEFQGVSFAYPGAERSVLDGVSFVAEAGQTVAIVGPTGAGKSTVIDLLARLYDPTEGRILLDGVPLTDVDLAELRTRIGMVPQDSFLFSQTIQHNVALGIDALELGEEALESAVRSATTVAQLHDQIMAFPQQYQTYLGERGINLSGGQKQRATLARAIARDPLILVLDDALSAVDTHTETAILADLRDVLGDRTAFIISHRVSAVMHADKIVVLEGGKVVQVGTHSELIGSEGTYARLLRRQMLEEDLGARGRNTAARVVEKAGVGD